MRAAHRGDRHARGQAARQLREGQAEETFVAQRDLRRFHDLRGRLLDLHLERDVQDVQKQDRPGDAEGIRDAVGHGGIVVFHRCDRDLKARRAGAAAREHAERVGQLDAERNEAHRHETRDDHADARGHVRLHALAAREPAKELRPVLNADAIQKQQEPERAQERGRRGLGRERADGEPDEQHRARTERHALDIDLADEIPQRDRQKEREKRLILEKRPDCLHAASCGRTSCPAVQEH